MIYRKRASAAQGDRVENAGTPQCLYLSARKWRFLQSKPRMRKQFWRKTELQIRPRIFEQSSGQPGGGAECCLQQV